MWTNRRTSAVECRTRESDATILLPRMFFTKRYTEQYFLLQDHRVLHYMEMPITEQYFLPHSCDTLPILNTFFLYFPFLSIFPKQGVSLSNNSFPEKETPSYDG